MQLTQLPFVVVDNETTGLHPSRHGIVQIGAVDLRGREPREFYLDVRAAPGVSVDPESLAVNGMSCEECFDESRTDECDSIEQFLEFVGEAPFMIAGMNPRFDRDFLKCAAIRSSSRRDRPIFIPFTHRTVDLHTLGIQYALLMDVAVPERGLNTDAIYALLGMPPEPKPHHALTGARWEAEAFSRLLAQ